ncbi:hypothetical protein OAA26_00090 [bacterium]|nr:hypothetical protein [bacterium]
MSTRVDRILIGSPTYKVVVGNVTQIQKVVVGTPLSTVVIGPYADIDNIVGVDTSGKTDGGIFVYDSGTGNFIVTNETVVEVDGKTYPSDSAHSNILIRRSATQGEPLILQQGEMAYSYLDDPSTDGFGNGGDRLYFATGDNDVDGNSTQIEIIGGKYFTSLMQHEQGVLTPNAAILTNASSRVDRLLSDSASHTILRSDTIFTQDLRLTSSTITADSANIRSTNGTNFITWSSLQNTVKLYTESGVALFTTDSDLGIGLGTQPGIEIPETSNLIVKGRTFLDSTDISGDLNVVGNLSIIGDLTTISTTELLVQDKRIIIGRGVPNALAADQSGIAIGDSNTPIATITYVNNGIDSAAWVFDPKIKAIKGEFTELQFEVIDCGIYA